MKELSTNYKQYLQENLEEILSTIPPKQEILDFLGLSEATLDAYIQDLYKCSFDAYYNKRIANAKLDLRKKVIELATDTSKGREITKNQALMLMFISKSVLGLSEERPLKTKETFEDKMLANFDKMI